MLRSCVRQALLVATSASVIACSSLGSRDACTADSDCKGERLCTTAGVCADPVRCADGKLVSPDVMCERASEQIDACVGACAAAGDASNPADASRTTSDATTACDGGSCATRDGGTSFCATADQSCYETSFSTACPGDEWTPNGARWSCESTVGVHWLHYEVFGWNNALPDAALGPTLELTGRTKVAWEITHRFNPDEGFGMSGALVLFEAGGDPHTGFELQAWLHPESHTSTQDEQGSIDIAALPESLRAQAQLAILAGGNKGLGVASPMKWDIVRIALRAE